jgi:hypothetical protein
MDGLSANIKDEKAACSYAELDRCVTESRNWPCLTDSTNPNSNVVSPSCYQCKGY